MLKNIVLIVIFTTIGFLGTLGIYLFLAKEHSQIISPAKPTQFSFEKAPKESVAGTITSLSGKVLWTSRLANSSIPLSHPQSLQQGEALATDNTSEATVTFPDVLIISLQKNSAIDIIQTLPANIVIKENNGKVVYQKKGSMPISVRAFGLLLDIVNGQSTIYVDKDAALVFISVQNGLATLAYTDTNNISQVVRLKAGRVITFDDNTKTID